MSDAARIALFVAAALLAGLVMMLVSSSLQSPWPAGAGPTLTR